MAIPRYQREGIDAKTAVRQTRGMAEKAEAQGQAGVAQAQSQLAGQHGQRANQEVASFGERLNTFTKQLDYNMGQHAMQSAEAKASDDLLKMKKNIYDLEQDETLDPKVRQEKIDEARVKLKDIHLSTYGKAYANAVQGDFNNRVTIDASEKALEAMKAAKNNPNMFKDAYQKYEKEIVDSAPDSASRLVAKRAFEKQGISTYKKMWKTHASTLDKEAKKTAEFTTEKLETQYINEVENGDAVLSDETQTQYNIVQKQRADKGWITQAEAGNNGYKLNIKAQQAVATKTFNEAFDAGHGPEAYEQINALNESGQFNHWESTKRTSLMTGMETKIKQKANDLYSNISTSFTNGNMPTTQELNEAERYLPYMSEQNQLKYATQKKATEVYYGVRGQKLSDQVNEIESLSNVEDLSLEERAVVAGVSKIVQQKVAKAKSDPIMLGNEEGLFTIDNIEPGKTTPEMISKRYQESGMASTQYGFTQQFFTTQETEAIKDFMVDPMVSANEKLAFITNIDKGTDGNSHVAFNQMNKKGAPLFAGVGDLVNEGRSGIALSVLKGQQAFNEGTLDIDAKSISTDINSEFGNSFFYSGAGDAKKAKATVQARYAYLVAQGEDPDIDDVMETILGDKGTVNSQDFYAPPGVDAGDVEDFLEDLDTTKMIPMLGVPPEQSANAIERSKPVHVGKGVYRFIFQGKTLQNLDGSPYELEYIDEN